MRCPHDNTMLVIAERNGIEIDYCPLCRGVWLDRGELDKLIERSLDVLPPAPAYPPPAYDPRQPPVRDRDFRQHPPHDPRREPPRGSDRDRYESDRYDREDDDRYRKRRRKDSFLGEIFDIFD